ncbi:glycosylphosphatidylinositol anchor biosynthesis [Pestalotiopsis sp. 9143b]|nr:glycosylphosphatidylinositol anchor biosynthesis [Pestalotiopsis sp. 9143b]
MAPSNESRDGTAAVSANDASLARPVQENTAAAQVKDALAVLFAFRIANVLCVRTYFQPDEYFQALEPAWQLVFGPDSGAWMTWEWQYRLRSSLHPGIFALSYAAVANYLSTISLPGHYRAFALLAAPKVVQAGLAALTDWFAWRLAEKLFGRNTATAWSVLLMSVANPWQWYCSTRTFSNCFEATLTIAALHYFPWELLGLDKSTKNDDGDAEVFQKTGSVNSLRLSIVFAAFAILLRPTNAFIWAAVGTLALTRLTMDGRSPFTTKTVLVLMREALLCGSFALGLSLLADKQYFGEWTFPPLNWLNFNIAQSLAIFYGQNDWHYYLSQGITLSCTTLSPFAVMGLLSFQETATSSIVAKNAFKALSFAVLITISTLSFIVHKEVRFIYPLLPLLHILAAPYITSFFIIPQVDGIPTSRGAVGIQRKPLLVLGLLVNLVIATYLSYFHSAGPILVMDELRAEFQRIHPQNLTIPAPFTYTNETAEPLELFALFLMPCHATPWRSHLIYPALRARALTCDPPLHTAPGSAEREAYVPEDRRFDADKVGFLANELWSVDGLNEEVPRYIVGYEGIESALQEYFGASGPGADKGVSLKQTWCAWNGLFTDDDRKSGEIKIWDTGLYSNA